MDLRPPALVALLVTGTALTVAVPVVPEVPGPVAPASISAPASGPVDGVDAAAIVREWDDRRSAAWAAADVTALAALYTARSPAGRVDRSMLGAWTRRGWRIEDLRMQLLVVRVRHWSADRLVLRVTDRLAGGVAVGSGLRVPLPRDTATVRTITWRRVAGEWRVAAVSGQASPVRTTS